jgi:hypothetical protein
LYFVLFLVLFLRRSLIFPEMLPAQDILDNMVIAEDGVASFNFPQGISRILFLVPEPSGDFGAWNVWR